MIPRYTTPEMAKIFSDENKYKIWLKIEILVAKKMSLNGDIPASSMANIEKKCSNLNIDVQRINTIEDTVKHDVIAFLTFISETIGDDAKYLHLGLTSSDILDTTLNVQITQAIDLIDIQIAKLLASLKKQAEQYKDLLCVGRSHGIHAEPTSFGLKFARFYAEFSRAKTRLATARDEISTCAISGSVGTFANIDSNIEEYVAKNLNLKVEPISTQIIPRDRHAAVFTTLALIASSMENIATEIRHLQRTEVNEAEEFFAKGQKGSSSMPHKRNPVLSENLTGLARLIRSCALPALENVTLWHERDISHSSVERGIAPDAFVHLHFALKRLVSLVENLVIYPHKVQANLDLLGGLMHSQHIMLELVKKGMVRELAYEIIQSNAMKCWEKLRANHSPKNDNNQPLFLELLLGDARLMEHFSTDEIQSLFDNERHIQHIDKIFARVFNTKDI